MFLKANINEWDVNFVAQSLAGNDFKVSENTADLELVSQMLEGSEAVED